MLSNTVAEVQLDCMQRLVHSLCNAGRVQLLCVLPFSANLLVSLSWGLTAWLPRVPQRLLRPVHLRGSIVSLLESVLVQIGVLFCFL